jgi:hypothetical protein
MKLQVKIKSNYGQQVVYPACVKSEQFVKELGTKTLTSAQISALKSLGFELEVISDQPKTL